MPQHFLPASFESAEFSPILITARVLVFVSFPHNISLSCLHQFSILRFKFNGSVDTAHFLPARHHLFSDIWKGFADTRNLTFNLVLPNLFQFKHPQIWMPLSFTYLFSGSRSTGLEPVPPFFFSTLLMVFLSYGNVAT